MMFARAVSLVMNSTSLPALVNCRSESKQKKIKNSINFTHTTRTFCEGIAERA